MRIFEENLRSRLLHNEEALLIFSLRQPGIFIQIQKRRKCRSKQGYAESQQHGHTNIDPHHGLLLVVLALAGLSRDTGNSACHKTFNPKSGSWVGISLAPKLKRLAIIGMVAFTIPLHIYVSSGDYECLSDHGGCGGLKVT